MELNVCKEITSMYLNDKTIALLQPNLSPGHYNLKLQAIRFAQTNRKPICLFCIGNHMISSAIWDK